MFKSTLGSQSKEILTIRGLEKIYPNGVHALNGINLDVYPGEFLVVIGLSGSGKSTLLRCINRLEDATNGQIIFEGKDVTRLKGEGIRQFRRDVGMIFQGFNLIPRRTVFENILMGRLGYISSWRSCLGIFSQSDREMAKRYLDLVGLSDRVNNRADQLSGGQQQRVAIARALTQNPKLILADEPVASLDPVTCNSIMEYLQKINRELGLTIICNLHFLDLVKKYATRVIALKKGEIVYEGSPVDLSEEWFEKIYGPDSPELQ